MKQIEITQPRIYISPPNEKVLVNVLRSFYKKQYASIWFKGKLNQMEISEDKYKYPHSLFFEINGDLVMENDKEEKLLFVSYIYWLTFENQFAYNFQEARDLIKNMVEEHFKIKIFPPCWSGDY